ncbi:hypothetical protein SAMN05443575_4059 [Jatrophihabitans endophyticus]|uniref:DUF5709 domain-containing protein n=1 Tax=Jatrophihabitans endophyticus TaxID=1206085 RepID=A0A1M5TWJ0_9ACTN|nr:DUF5709 domain-containing protein [Jatrophihabitans endophyticus]SHH55089.1 hypothetical protein SAMN05443575_4059 [Jatrophihabitans endophyticus]
MSERESDDLYEGVVVDRDQADPSDTLTGDNTEDPLDAGYSPPERAQKSWRGETAEEALEGESLDAKLAEEEPDVSEADLDRADEAERTGRLVAPDEGAHPDEEKDEVATDVGRAGYAASAEEAAMHAADEAAPPAHTDGPETV